MTTPPHLSSRPGFSGAEFGQCKVRLAIVVLGTCWYLAWLWVSQAPSAMRVLPIMGAYFVYSLVHMVWTRILPAYNPLRMAIVTFFDQALSIYFLAVSGGLGTIYVFAGPWISIGNGLRFGSRWMAASAAVAVTGLALAGWFSPYWQQNPVLLLGLLILNVTIPFYVAILLAGLEKSRQQLVSYADKLEKLAMLDDLTGLPNRTALYGELTRACADADRHPLALLYFDLDGFKFVNDTYGHMLGDALLRETAARVNVIVRNQDVVARLGGDEFVVLLRGPDAIRRAAGVAERILHALLTIGTVQGKPVEVSASLGGIVIAGHTAARFTAESLLHEADKNMYQAKRNGKNGMVLTGLDENARCVDFPARAIARG